VIGARGLLEYIFGSLNLTWGPTRPAGPRRRPYGSRQRTNAAAGQPMFLQLDTGQIYSVRITSTQSSFLDQITTRAAGKVLRVWSQRGTDYGRKTAELDSLP
jgi:hypothetical protein